MDPAFQHLSGITIQRLEKPKPKPESQNPPPTPTSESDSSFEYDDEEESSNDSLELDRSATKRSDIESLKQNLNSSVKIERRVIDTSDSVTIDRTSKPTTRVVDVSQIQSFKRNLDDSVTIDRRPISNKRVLESSIARISDSVTLDSFPVSKRSNDFTDVQTPKTFNDSVSIEKPKRIVDADSVTFNSVPVNKRDAVSIDRPISTKRVVDSSEVVTSNKWVLDSADVQNFTRNLGDSVTFNAVSINKPTVGRRVVASNEVQKTQSLGDSVTLPVANRVVDAQIVKQLDDSASELQYFSRNLGDSVKLDRLPSTKRVVDLQSLDDSTTKTKSVVSAKRVIDASELHLFSRSLSDSITLDKRVLDVQSIKQPLHDTASASRSLDDSKSVVDDSATITKSAVSAKRVIDTNEVHMFSRKGDSVTFDSFPVAKRVVETPLDDTATIIKSTVSAKRVIDANEVHKFSRKDDSVSFDNFPVAKRVVETQSVKQPLDDTATITKSTVNAKRVIDANEVHKFSRKDDLVTFDSVSVAKRVVETQSVKQPLDDTATITKSTVSAKRVIDVDEVHKFSRNLDNSVTFDNFPVAKRVVETQSVKQPLDDLATNTKSAAKHVIGFDDSVKPAAKGVADSQTLDDSATITKSAVSSKRVIDASFSRNLSDSVTLDSFPVAAKRVVDIQTLEDSATITKSTVKRVIDASEVHNFNRSSFSNAEKIDTSPEDSSETSDDEELAVGSTPIDNDSTNVVNNSSDELGEAKTLPSRKRALDLTDVQSVRTGSGKPTAKRVIDTSELFSLKQTLDIKQDSTPNEEQLNDVAINESEITYDEDCANSSDSQNRKRSLDDPFDTQSKKLKTSPETEKQPITNASLSDIPTDDEISEFGSDFDSESELDSEIVSIKREAAASFNNEPDPSFLEKLVDDSFLDKTVPDIQIKTESDSTDEAEDYDYDIKEKLKEMGEISFETVKKGDKKPDSENEASTSKKGVEDDVVIERKGPGGGVISSSMMRRNIREVMDEAKLDQSTLAAQREEMERLQRVQEQQRIIREVQRQMAQERMQNKVLSLLQGGSLSKTGSSGTRIGNTVLMKLPNGETRAIPKPSQQPFDLVKLPKGQPSLQKPPQGEASSTLRPPGTNPSQLTPSVSIAPVSKKPLPSSRPYSDSEGEYEDPRMQRPSPRGRPPKPSTLTTAEATSDDDCIVVSDTEVEQSLDDEIIEDPSNSGMHTNDEFNQPDQLGRVVINIGHPEGEPDLYIAPQLARIIKPHQIGGVRFLYDNVIESINRFDSSTGFGCILAHSMGLGKTLQVICFSDIFLRHTSAKTILCIMPINTLQNWLAEYNMWLPAEEDAAESPLGAQGEIRSRTFGLYVLNDSHKTITSRARVVQAWKSSGGVLLIGYEQYRLLSLRKQPKSRRKPQLVQPEDEDKNRKLLDDIHCALVMPGPDLVICDEGHRIKNSHASISQALKQMRTKRRVVLTGYPLQNNLMEYWCMVDFARPNYLGSKSEFCNMFERPIQNGQCMDSTEADVKLMRYRAHVLHSLLVGFVQRRSHEVLQNALPQKEEYVLLLRMTDFQRKLYNVFMNEVVRCQSVPNPLKAFAVCCKIWNHPDVLYNFLKNRAGGETVDIDLEEVSNTSSTVTNTPIPKPRRTPRRSTTPRGRRCSKPAASVTPNNTREQEKTPLRTRRGNFISPNPGPDSSEFFHNENANFPTSSFGNQQGTTFCQTSETNRQISPTSFSNSNSNSFQNIKQQLNLWGQNESNSTNSREWGNLITSPVKNELGSSSSESKPKINIISDIKVGSPFSNPIGGKKINIISDIKLEVKKDESVDDKRCLSKYNMDSMKNEIKTLMKNSNKLPNRRISEDEDVKIVSEMPPPRMRSDDGQDGIPYDWAIELVKDYIPGCIEYSAKTEVLFCILRESISLGDRLLLFSQSLITLDVIEQFLQTNNVPGQTEKWAKNTNYYRLDGSTSALEREKLINEFNANPKIHLFLVSTRAGSLGINLVGANRVIVFDASWNPCHDTQAVCRVYRYGQRKPCFVYRFVMDHCLEKKIYDRQINKQGMSDRVVDECNPDSHVTMKDMSTLCFDDTDEGEAKDWSCVKDNYIDIVLQKVLEKFGTHFNKQPFQHESLLVDRKDKQLSQQEKRLAKKGYEREKQASRQPAYSFAAGARSHRPVASVRPMLQGGERPSRWIPAEHWQRQGMTAQEMTLPLDVVIPTNQPDKSNIILKAGQKVLVLKSPKGVYMQLENGKIVAIKTAIKVRGKAEEDAAKMTVPPMRPPLPPLQPPNMPLLPPKRMVRPFTPGRTRLNIHSVRQPVPNLIARMQNQRMQGPPRKPIKAPLFQPSNDPRPSKPDTESKKLQLLTNDDITMEKFTSGKAPSKIDPPVQQVSLLKNMQQRGAISISASKPHGSAIQQLEQSTSTLIAETKQRVQDISEIAGSYQEEEKASASDSSSVAPIESDDMQEPDDVEDIEDLDEAYEDEELVDEKGDGSQNVDYNYGGYYSYNQSYPGPQPYGSYPPPHQPYDYNYGQPQQPYNYGMYPQGYPQPQYSGPPPQPYDPYAPHPPQPMYGGYPPYPQYPPPPNSYPPAAPPPPHTYPDYQYNTATPPQNPSQSSNSNYYPNT